MQNQLRREHQTFGQDNYQNSVHKSLANQSTQNYINHQQSHRNSLLSGQEVFQEQISKLSATIQDISKLINSYNRINPKQYKQRQFPAKGINYHKQVIDNQSKQFVWQNNKQNPKFPLKKISKQEQAKLNKTTQLLLEEDNEPTFRIRNSKDEINMNSTDKIEKNCAQKHVSVKEAHLNKIEQDIIEMKKKYQYSTLFYKKDHKQNTQIQGKKQQQMMTFEQDADEALTLQLSQSSESCLLDQNCRNLNGNCALSINNQQQYLKNQTYKKINYNNTSQIKKITISPLPLNQAKRMTKNVQNHPQQRYLQQTKRRDFYHTSIATEKKPDSEMNSNFLKQKPSYFKNQSNGFRQIKPEQKKSFSQTKMASPKSFIQHNKLMINTYQQRSTDKKNQDSPRKCKQLKSFNRSKQQRNKIFQKYLHTQQIENNSIEKYMRNTTFSPSKINSNNLRTKKNNSNNQANWIRDYKQQYNAQAYFNTFYRKVKDYSIVKGYLNKQQLRKIFMHRILPQNIIEHKWGMTVIDYARMKQRGSILNF